MDSETATSSQPTNVKDTEEFRARCKEQAELYTSLCRLEANYDFQVLLKDYISNEAARLVSLLAESSFNMSDKRELHRNEIKERLIGIARFNEYLRLVRFLGMKAEDSLKELNKDS